MWPEDGDDCVAVCGVAVISVYLGENVCERGAEHHAMDGPEAVVARVEGPLGNADVEKTGAGAELLQDGEMLGEGEVGLDGGE